MKPDENRQHGPDTPAMPALSPPAELEMIDEHAWAALLLAYERQMLAEDEAECGRGCDWPDGPLAPQGSRW